MLLGAVKARLDCCKPQERIATLGFDAMSLTEALRYHEHLDRVVGFEDVGACGRTGKVANQALVGVVRGIIGSWKLPIAYYLIRDNPSQDRFQCLVNECLAAVHEVGVDVRVLTCDQERTQWAWLKKAGVTADQPYFSHPVTKQPVYVIPDPPHCLKNARNALRRHDIMYAQGRFARWADFVQLVDLECSRELRAAPKLSREHVELPIGRNMSVKLAAQTFSRSSAAAIRTYVRLGDMCEAALSTADFMERVNDAFDCANGTSPNAPVHKAALCADNMVGKVAELRCHAEWIATWRFFQHSDKKESHRHQFHIGWQVALRAMAQLSPLLILGGLSFVPLRRLGQDHVENLFCCVRGRNGYNSRPDCSAFRPALRACALTSMLKPISGGGNCEEDGDKLLVNILEKASWDCRTGRAHRAASTATALVQSLLGDGVDLDDGDSSTVPR